MKPEDQKKRKIERQNNEEGEFDEEAGHGEARWAHGEVGQFDGEARGQGETRAERQEHEEGRRRRSGEGGRDLL